MSQVDVMPEDESIAIERMLDDGAPSHLPPRLPKAKWASVRLQEESSAEDRAAQRRVARRMFRLYCLACGRSSEVSIAPMRPGRCLHCSGTLLVEVAPD
jgi:hypothetical protein